MRADDIVQPFIFVRRWLRAKIGMRCKGRPKECLMYMPGHWFDSYRVFAQGMRSTYD